MEICKEFKELSLQFYQELEYENFDDKEQLYKFVLDPFKEDNERGRLRSFLDAVTQDSVSDAELQKLWRSSSADIVFHDSAYLRAMLRDLRDRL